MNQEKNKAVESLYKLLDDALVPLDGNKLFGLKSLYIRDNKERYYVGDKVYLDVSLESFTKDTLAHTHKITALRGNLRDTHHEIDLEDLNDGSLLTVKL